MRFAGTGRLGHSIAMLAAFSAAGAVHAQSTPPAAAAPRAMTAQEAQDVQHVLGMLKPGRPYVLNLADPQQLRFTQRALAAAGRTPANAPATFAALQSTVQQAHKLAAAAKAGPVALAATPLQAKTAGAPQDLALLSNFGDDGNGVYTATGYSSVMGGTTQTTITTELFDTANQTVFAVARNTQFGQGTNFQVPVSGKVSDPAHLAAMTTIVTTVGSNSTTTVISTAAQVPATAGTMTAPNYCVRTNPSDPSSNCVINGGKTTYQTGSTTLVPNPPLIKICFNRGSQQSCDYYNASGRPATSVFFPTAGTATFGSYTIDSSYATAGTYTASVADPNQGGACVFADHQPLGTGWSASGSTITWNLSQVSPTNPNNCLGYSGGRPVTFNFYIELPLDLPGGQKNTGFVNFTSAFAPPMPPGFLGVPGIYLEDSCVAAGTKVHMADGSETPIENITADNSPQVISATGDKRTVQGTASGVELHPMIHLKTSLGQDLLITRTHPVLTVNGLVMARDLKAGDSVKTEKGVAKIVSVAAQAYTGHVYSLRLGWFDEAKSDKRTHSANGIFIGDSISQVQMEQEDLTRLKTDKNEVMRRLPNDQWRKEYQTFLQQSH
jgi:hypothetical protein